MCRLKDCLDARCRLHSWHLNGVRVRSRQSLPLRSLLRWRIKLDFCMKDFSQWAHWNGLSPVWVLKWNPNVLLCVNFLPHTSHMYGWSPKYEKQVTSAIRCKKCLKYLRVVECVLSMKTFGWILHYNLHIHTRTVSPDVRVRVASY